MLRVRPVVAVATLTVLLAAQYGLAADAPEGTAVSSKIRRVTVYSDRARITRTGSVTLAGGRQRLFVPDLPAAIDNGSVSASFPSSKSAKILSIDVETTYGKQTSRKEAEALIAKGKDLDRKLRAIDDETASLGAEEQFLRAFQVKTRPDEKGRPVAVSLDTGSWQQTLSFVTDGLTGALGRERAKQYERRDVQKQRDALEVDLQKVRSYESEATKRVVVEVEGPAGASDLEIVYGIAGPSWRPAYDVRVISSTGKVEIVTHGVIRQQTGEDWKDVDLTFSTASPEKGADLPQLLAWRLGDQQEFSNAVASGEVVGSMNGGLATERPADDAKKIAEAPSPKVAVTRDAVQTMSVAGGVAKSERWSRHSSDKPEPSRAPAGPPPPPPPPSELASQPDLDGDYAPDVSENEESISSTTTTGRGGGEGYGAAARSLDGRSFAAGMKNKREDDAYRRAQPAVIRAMADNVWSLPAGHAFNFVNIGAAGFSWSGDVLRCPAPVISAGGFDYAFKPQRKVSVLSDGRERKVKLASKEMPATLLYEVVAPISKKAYLRATMVNAAKQPFLAGESFVFLDDDFVGRAFIGTVAPNEKLDLSLGIDEDVKVERRSEQSAEQKGVFSKKERTQHTTVITIKSYKKRAIDVLLRDQAPITWQKDDITVEDVKLTPDPLEEKKDAKGNVIDSNKPTDAGSHPKQGLYAWKLSIPAGGKQEVKLAWTVEHPRDFDLVERWGTR